MPRRVMALAGRALALPVLCALAEAAFGGARARAAVLEVGPEAAPGWRAVTHIGAAELTPGTIVHLHAGFYPDPIVIQAAGTRDAPVTVQGAGDGPIMLAGPIALDNAAFVIVRDLQITHAADAAIILRHGSHHITVQGNSIAGARLGIWIGQEAGDANLIEDNTINGSTTHGIAVDRVNAEAGAETILLGNHIADSGIHGIELSGNFYRVQDNIVSGSGRLSTGASGIHIFASHAGAGVGAHNAILGNISFDNHDASAQDGNGIQLDQWCDDNLVSGNITVGNDGAGISVFDAARARIEGNTLYGNMRDPGHSHRHRGNLVFATDDQHDVDGTRDGVAEGNIVVSTVAGSAPVLVDGPTSKHPPSFAHNLLHAQVGQGVARWNGRDVPTLAEWNALAPHREPDAEADPGFADPAAATRAGFTPVPGSPASNGFGAVPPPPQARP